jgi:hypothetical protein
MWFGLYLLKKDRLSVIVLDFRPAPIVTINEEEIVIVIGMREYGR